MVVGLGKCMERATGTQAHRQTENFSFTTEHALNVLSRSHLLTSTSMRAASYLVYSHPFTIDLGQRA